MVVVGWCGVGWGGVGWGGGGSGGGGAATGFQLTTCPSRESYIVVTTHSPHLLKFARLGQTPKKKIKQEERKKERKKEKKEKKKEKKKTKERKKERKKKKKEMFSYVWCDSVRGLVDP